MTWAFRLVTDSIDILADTRLDMQAAGIAGLPSVLVVCLCARWCNVCTEYLGRFEQVQRSIQANYPQAQFVWLDIEDEADLLHPLDVENFPTLLIAVGDAPRFFGTITPQAQTLERLVRHIVLNGAAPEMADPELRAAVTRIRAAWSTTAKSQ